MRSVRGKHFWLTAGILLFCVVLAATVTLLLVGTRHKARNLPPLQTTERLLATTTKLRDSFGQTNSNTGKVTREYIGYARDLSEYCTSLISAADKTQPSSGNADTVILLKNSKSLCMDLREVSSTTASLYTSLLPVLSIQPTTKRYQTLPLIKQNVISSQTSKVDSALTDLKSSKIKNAEYVKLAITRLAVVQNNMKSAKGFSYLASLNTFQVQQIAERQQYWTGAADIEGLISALKLQLQNYCQASPEDAKTAVCTSNTPDSISIPTSPSNNSQGPLKVLN